MNGARNVQQFRCVMARLRSMPLLVSNTLWMVATQFLQLGLRMVYFVLLTRALGSHQYGAFVATTALVSLCYPLVTLGMGNLLIKNVAQERARFNTYWGNTLFVICTSSLLILLLLVPLSAVILPSSIPRDLVCLVAVADLLMAGTIDAAGKAYQSISRLSRTGMLLLSVTVFRVIAAALILTLLPAPTALGWGVAYAASTALAAILALAMVTRDMGRPRLRLQHMRQETGEGLLFTLSAVSQNMRNQMGKVMLARMATLEMTGTYGAASRLVNLALIPVRALMQASYPRFFEQGAHGITCAATVARRLLPITLGLGLLASVGIYVMAPVAPYLLGAEYQSAVDALRLLCPLPLLRAALLPASDVLSGAGFQQTRCSVLGAAALLNFLSNLWLIPRYAWRGSAFAAIITDTFLMAGLWLSVWFLCRTEAEGKSP